jgi:hypothetical protein
MPGRRVSALMLATTLVAVTLSCDGDRKPVEMYYPTKTYAITISPSVSPPHAREDILWKIVVRDRRTRQPIEEGEGQIYANTREGPRTWDALVYGEHEVGTYYGKLNFTVSGLWAMAIRFRRDSLHPLETINWMQDVLAERGDSIR